MFGIKFGAAFCTAAFCEKTRPSPYHACKILMSALWFSLVPGRTLKTMEDRRFEWAVVENACCEAAVRQCLDDMKSWRLLNPRFQDDMVFFPSDKRLDWLLRTFTIYWDLVPVELGRFFQCHVMGTFQEDIWAYRLEFYEDDEDDFTEFHKQALCSYAVALREIPSSLVVNCNLVIEENFLKPHSQPFQAENFYI